MTKNWKIIYNLRDLETASEPLYTILFNDLNNNTADIVMCSIWLSPYENKYDLSTFHELECGTLLVPRPKRLSEFTAIYTTLSGQVWLVFGICFFATGFSLWGSARIEIVERTVYMNVSRTFLEVMNIATSHGVRNFPRQRSIKLLLLR